YGPLGPPGAAAGILGHPVTLWLCPVTLSVRKGPYGTPQNLCLSDRAPTRPSASPACCRTAGALCADRGPRHAVPGRCAADRSRAAGDPGRDCPPPLRRQLQFHALSPLPPSPAGRDPCSALGRQRDWRCAAL